MRRPLPKLHAEVHVETRGTGAELVVQLSLPGGRKKSVSEVVWGAVALLDAYDDVDTWKQAARERNPALTDAKLDKLLTALEENGFVAVAGAQPKPPPATPSMEGPELLEVSAPVKRPAFSKEITQVHAVPIRPPMVRRDIKATRTDKPGTVRVTLPEGGSYDMPEREYRILLELDGIRDLRTIHAAMSAKGAPFSFEQLAMFVVSMTRQGLVVDDASTLINGGASAQPRNEGELERGRSLLGTGQWALAEQALAGFLTTNPRHELAQELLAQARAEMIGAFPSDGGDDGAATPSTDGHILEASAVTASAEPEAAEAQPSGEAQSWDSADAVASSPEAKKRRRQRRLKQLARVGAVPAALLLVGSLVRYPLTITYECELEPLESRTVRSPIEGVVAAVAVDEGAHVVEDQVLGNLDNAALQLEVVKNKAALERANAELELLKQGSRKEEVDRAQARIHGLSNEAGIASSRLSRVRGLVKQGVAPREEQDRAAGELASIMGQLSQAKADLTLLKAGARPDDLRKKEAELNSLKAQVELSERQLAATVLKSPMPGVITTQKPKDKINTRVAVGDAIFEVVRPEKMRATVLVDERDFDLLKKGLPMKVKVSAYPVDEFSGEVNRIAEKVEQREGARIIRTEGIIDNADGKLVPHMSGFAEIQGEPRPLVSLFARRLLRWVRVRFLI